ncbi:hypothetical protein IAU59_000490 [Kwoniella sp. CBS 9459]
MPPKSTGETASAANGNGNGNGATRSARGVTATKNPRDGGKRKYQEVEDDSDSQGGSLSSDDDGVGDGDEVYHGSDDSGGDEDSELTSEEEYEEQPAKSRKTAAKSKSKAQPVFPAKGKGKDQAQAKPKDTAVADPKSQNKKKQKTAPESDPPSDIKPKSKSKSETKSETKAGKAKTKTPTIKTKPTNSKTKTQSQITELLEYLLSDEVFDEANPSPKKGYGEVDWAKHTSPANPKTAKDPLPKPEPSSGQKRTAEEKAVPEYLDGQNDIDDIAKDDQGKSDSDRKSRSARLIRYPFSPMTPFQTLVACLLLSKPLSHKLGIRTITTLLNPPFDFGTFSSLADTDEERRREGMWAARTQHKEKTAAQLGELVDGVRGLNGEGEEDDLGGIKRAISAGSGGQGGGLSRAQAQQRVGDMLKTIKGIGNVGVSIFLRRIQSQWPEVYPYVDDRCLASAKYLGLLGEDLTSEQGAEKLSELVDGDRDRGKLTRLLDTLIGLDLEKKLDSVAERFA